MKCVLPLLALAVGGCMPDLEPADSGLVRTTVRPDPGGGAPTITREAIPIGAQDPRAARTVPTECADPLFLYDGPGLEGNELVLCGAASAVEYDLRAIEVPGRPGTTWWAAAKSYAALGAGRFEMTPHAGQAGWGTVFDRGAVDQAMDIHLTPYVSLGS